MRELTHIDETGSARMVDVGGKDVTEREAVAEGRIRMSEACFAAVMDRSVPKGDVFSAARIAGIMGAKRTSELIPLCHALALTHASVEFEPLAEPCEILARCRVRCTGRTGVEMEALTGVSTALLTIYDMCKALDRRMEISHVHLVMKSGGKSGAFLRDEAPLP